MKRKPSTRVKRHTVKRKPKRPSKAVSQSLGQNIRSARERKNLTQRALAHSIGYNGDDAGAYISRVEANVQAPRIDTLLRIAKALGVTMCSLLSK